MRWVCLIRSRAYTRGPSHRRRPLLITAGTAPIGGGPKNEATTYRGSIARPFHHGTAGRSAPLQLRASGPAHVHSPRRHPPLTAAAGQNFSDRASPAREISAQTAKIARVARSVSGGAKRMGAAKQTQHTRPGATIVADLPISRVCTTTLGCVQVGSSPCRRGGLLTEPSPTSGPPGSGRQRRTAS